MTHPTVVSDMLALQPNSDSALGKALVHLSPAKRHQWKYGKIWKMATTTLKKKVWNKRNSRGRIHDTKYALTYWKHRNPSLQYTASSQRNEKWDSRKCHSLGTYLNMLRRGRRSTCTSSRQPFKKKKPKKGQLCWVLLSTLFQNTALSPCPISNFPGKGANDFILLLNNATIQSTLQFLPPLGREAVRSGRIRIKDESQSCDKRIFLTQTKH